MDTQHYNMLGKSTSMYLKRSAKSPIFWRPFGPNAIDLAQQEEKLIFLSLGMASCHWCHVMERECFYDETLALQLNDHFISIKIDIEENPEIDFWLQELAQKTGRRNGYPFTAILTSDMRPIFLSTYLPLHSSEKATGLLDIIKEYVEIKCDPEELSSKIEEFNSVKSQQEQKIELPESFPHPMAIFNALSSFKNTKDGGYGDGAKFPQYAYYEWAIEQILEGVIEEEVGQHIVISIEKMLLGAAHDHLRGGMHRYCSDPSWNFPHFEKMLYDQAAFVKLLSKSCLIYPAPLLLDALTLTLNYITNEMLSSDSLFFSSQDSESESVEGLYYCFSKNEIREALSSHSHLADKKDLLLKWFNFDKIAEKDANALVPLRLAGEHKEEFYQVESWNLIREAKQLLMAHRQLRMPPKTDTKSMSSWNMQMLSALCDVVQYTRIESIREQAKNLLNTCHNAQVKKFIQETDETICVIHSTDYVEGRYFEDYVFAAEACFRMSEILASPQYCELAIKLTLQISKVFRKDQDFYIIEAGLESGIIPNSVATHYDQSHKSALATYLGLIRKYSLLSNDIKELEEKLAKSFESLTQQTLLNPLAHGEGLRTLCYPKLAYKKIEMPQKWADDEHIKAICSYFSARFVIAYHQDENPWWQVCSDKECEIKGIDKEEFTKVFSVNQEEA